MRSRVNQRHCWVDLFSCVDHQSPNNHVGQLITPLLSRGEILREGGGERVGFSHLEIVIRIGVAMRNTSPRPGTVIPRFGYQRNVLLGHSYNVALRLHFGVISSALGDRSKKKKLPHSRGHFVRPFFTLHGITETLSDKAYYQSISGSTVL